MFKKLKSLIGKYIICRVILFFLIFEIFACKVFVVKIEKPNYLVNRRIIDLLWGSDYLLNGYLFFLHNKKYEDLRNICDKDEKLIEVKYFLLGPYRVICEKKIIDEASNEVNQEGIL